MKHSFFAVLAGAVGLLACSSSTSGGSSTCGVSDSAKVTTVKKTGGDAACPEISPSQLNNSSTDDSGAGGCGVKINASACTASVDCTETESGTTTKTTGSFSASGNAMKGTVSVTISGAASLSCTYDVTLQ